MRIRIGAVSHNYTLSLRQNLLTWNDVAPMRSFHLFSGALFSHNG